MKTNKDFKVLPWLRDLRDNNADEQNKITIEE